jgi:hypothetical protein
MSHQVVRHIILCMANPFGLVLWVWCRLLHVFW